MILFFLHGPPAAGKHTIAQELVGLTGAELFHNHIVVDEVLSRHAFGTAQFVRERDALWRQYFERYPGPGGEKVIFTFNPENSVPQGFVDWLFASMDARGIRLFSVEIVAPEDQLEARMGSIDRQQFKKLTDLKLYKKLRDAGTFAAPSIPRTDMTIDSGTLKPDEAAQLIVKAFSGSN